MTALETILNILSMILIELSATMIIKHLYPKFKKSVTLVFVFFLYDDFL